MTESTKEDEAGDPAMGQEESPDRNATLAEIEGVLGHAFSDRRILEEALRHSSFTHELRREESRSASGESGGEVSLQNNERLEFLGDAVLALVTAEALFRAKPAWREGELTRALHGVVEGKSLATLARRLNVGPALELGRAESSSGGADKDSLLENAMEALIGALYLDGGLPVAARFVETAFSDSLAADAAGVARDPKTALQERLMQELGELPVYKLMRDSEVEGDEDRFTASVSWQGQQYGTGIGRTKRTAQRRAARKALAQLETDSEGD